MAKNSNIQYVYNFPLAGSSTYTHFEDDLHTSECRYHGASSSSQSHPHHSDDMEVEVSQTIRQFLSRASQ